MNIYEPHGNHKLKPYKKYTETEKNSIKALKKPLKTSKTRNQGKRNSKEQQQQQKTKHKTITQWQ